MIQWRVRWRCVTVSHRLQPTSRMVWLLFSHHSKSREINMRTRGRRPSCLARLSCVCKATGLVGMDSSVAVVSCVRTSSYMACRTDRQACKARSQAVLHDTCQSDLGAPKTAVCVSHRQCKCPQRLLDHDARRLGAAAGAACCCKHTMQQANCEDKPWGGQREVNIALLLCRLLQLIGDGLSPASVLQRRKGNGCAG